MTPHSPPPLWVPEFDPYRVLVVEDNEDHVRLIEIVFGHLDANARVVVTRSGEEAVALLVGDWADADDEREELPDVIVLDLDIPGLSGLRFLEWRRERRDVAAIPLVVFTAAGDPDVAKRCFELGATEFLVKTSMFVELVPTVRRVLGLESGGASADSG